jgi:hypothetical protein
MGRAVLVAAVVTLLAAADAGSVSTPPASSFSAKVDNAWFPLKPGSRYASEAAQSTRSSWR